jgi:hypothetical protein
MVNAMHSTASVFINNDESGLHEGYMNWLESLAPFDPSPAGYKHNRTGEDNADARMKRQIMGREVVVAITKSKLDFGPFRATSHSRPTWRETMAVLGLTRRAESDPRIPMWVSYRQFSGRKEFRTG